ncbi:DUF3304 domain-containing protein [Zestomonas carbonaria]|uniref:DUF3304 domain-containing protein n=1 Tax=Zestomonas carbonaria TaxID=2762745 RepID=A0A7U7I9Z2_9GAMM|nr:DUF3304 domain-containing protein [Pseudomonas carbonaria]CAD5108261.1 hypothetical protein PSEWESI4_02546 [Pseudomonas carbonaria]
MKGLALLACLFIAGCKALEPRPSMIGVGLTGIDHLPDHLSVQNFWFNGSSGFQAGKGGRLACCTSLPREWQPGMTAVVRWHVTNWRDCKWERYERRVPVDRYQEAGRVWVHFLADGSVRVVSSGIGPGNPEYPGPQDAIPQKHPPRTYNGWSPRCPKQGQPEVKEDLE